jgi:hypothetical protein
MGQLTVEQARENVRKKNQQELVTPLFEDQIKQFVPQGKRAGGAPASPAAAAGPKRYRFNADGTMTES